MWHYKKGNIATNKVHKIEKKKYIMMLLNSQMIQKRIASVQCNTGEHKAECSPETTRNFI